MGRVHAPKLWRKADSVKCPHCRDAIHAGFSGRTIGEDEGDTVMTQIMQCPSCRRLIVILNFTGFAPGNPPQRRDRNIIVYPRNPSPRPLPAEVPPEYADDFNEAVIVAPFSAKASAALSRRCLQHLLREKAGVKAGSLNDEIQEVIDSGTLPADLADAIDAVRHVGNFAAHPIKSTESGSVVPVEPGEAEWSIETLEQLLDFYCVRPARLKAKRDALNEKLKEAGKPQLKSATT
jgi:hypothetical protein